MQQLDPVMIKCRGCKQPHPARSLLPPDAMCIGSLFDEEVPDNKVLGMFCNACETAHKSAKTSLEVLACGHQSIMHEEILNPVCFYPTCAEKAGKPQTEDDDCVFCAETLASNACAYLKCGHNFHVHCLQSSWEYLFNYDTPTDPIKLANSCCPLCKAPIEIDCEEYNEIYNKLDRIRELRTHLQHLIVAQIQHENGTEDGMPSNPLEYGMAHYTFFNCENCATVYCGGKRECGEAEVPAGTRMLCGGCRSCSKHGEDFMTFKCRFCCTEALWFCFGHTHFCEPCHDEAHELTTGNNNEFISKKVPPCLGKDKCPLKLDHPAHGVEFGWCAACIAEESADEFGADLVLLYPAKAKSNSVFDVEDVAILESLFEIKEIKPAVVIDDPHAREEEAEMLRIGSLFDEVDVNADEEPMVIGSLFGDDGDESVVLGSLFDDDETLAIGNLFDDEVVINADEEPMVIGSLFGDDEELVVLGSLFDGAEDEETVVIGSLFDDDEVVVMGSLFDEPETVQQPSVAPPAVNSKEKTQPITSTTYSLDTTSKYNLNPNKLITLAHQLYCNWAHIVVVAATAALLNDLSCTAV